MLSNLLIFVISATLAAVCLVSRRVHVGGHIVPRWMIFVPSYVVAFILIDSLYDTPSAAAVLILATVITVICEILALNYRMVNSPAGAKFRRCY
jgi:hypothetical protein